MLNEMRDVIYYVMSFSLLAIKYKVVALCFCVFILFSFLLS
jgi:hypothetical protein